MPKYMKFKLHIISEALRFLLSKGRTDFLRMLRYHSTLESIDCGHKSDASISTHVQLDSSRDYTAVGIRNETRHCALFSIPCEAEHDGTLHYPKAPQPAFRHDSFSYVKVSEMTRMNRDQTCLPRVGKQIYHHANEQHRNSQHFFWLDDAVISAPSLLVVPTYGTANHTAGNEPHPATRYRHRPVLSKAGLFFERTLNFRIGTSNHWSRLSQPKTKLSEKSLALACSQCNPKIFPDKG
jgi:hypothetical protein